MTVLRFEWDDAKASSNAAKHGITFEAAAQIFQDPHAVTVPDARQTYGEARFNRIGRLAGGIIIVCHTIRMHDRIRIISARIASRRERSLYPLHGAHP